MIYSRSRTPPSDHCPETSRCPPASRHLHQAPSEKRRNAFVTTEPDNRPCPLSPNCSLVTQQQDSQEDLFSSQEEEPEQKRRKTLQSFEEAEVGFDAGAENKHVDNEDVVDENNDSNRSSDEDDALPLTFHIKNGILRKLQEMQKVNRGKFLCHKQSKRLANTGAEDCNNGARRRSSSKICRG